MTLFYLTTRDADKAVTGTTSTGKPANVTPPAGHSRFEVTEARWSEFKTDFNPWHYPDGEHRVKYDDTTDTLSLLTDKRWEVEFRQGGVPVTQVLRYKVGEKPAGVEPVVQVAKVGGPGPANFTGQRRWHTEKVQPFELDFVSGLAELTISTASAYVLALDSNRAFHVAEPLQIRVFADARLEPMKRKV